MSDDLEERIRKGPVWSLIAVALFGAGYGVQDHYVTAAEADRLAHVNDELRKESNDCLQRQIDRIDRVQRGSDDGRR